MIKHQSKSKGNPVNLTHNNSFRFFIPAIIILVLIIAAYSSVFTAGFIWDDDTFLYENKLILSSDGISRFWFSTEAPDYFPLTSTMLWIEWRIFGMSASGYHIINILLHCISSILLWLILRELKISGAWFAGLIYGIHPVNVESVAWITERKNTLPMVFFCLSILLFLKSQIFAAEIASNQKNNKQKITTLKSKTKLFYIFSLIAFLLALLSKTAVVMMPFVLLLCLWYKKNKISKDDIIKTAPFFAFSFIFGLITVWFQYNRAIGEDIVRSDNFLSRMIISGWAVCFYLYKALLPINLCFVYPKWKADIASVLSYLPGLAIAAVMLIFFLNRKKWGRPLFFSFAYYLIVLFPVLGFVNIYFMKYSLVADHWQYFALPGIIAPAAGIAGYYYNKISSGKSLNSGAVIRKIILTAGILISAAFFALTFNQSRAYKNAEVLWIYTLNKNPEAGLAHNNLAKMYYERGEFEKSIEHSKKAIASMPDDMIVYYNYGNTLKDSGRNDEAIINYNKAILINPGFAHAYNNLGLVYTAKKEYSKAIDSLEQALKLKNDFTNAYLNLGNVYAMKKNFEEAVTQYQKALKINPEDASVYGNLGNVFAEIGQTDTAIKYYEKALEIAPDNQMIRNNYNIAKEKQGSK